MSHILNVARLPAAVQKKFIPYLRSLLEQHDGNVISANIYGSATGVNFIPKVSDINSVFVFKQLDFPAMKKSLRLIDAGIKQKIAAPLFLTQDYIRSSLDVFPMEFLDMQENHILVYGEDILKDLDIKTEHLRLFCEQQVKGKLVRIRQAFLEIGLKRKGQEALLKESLTALIPVFRNLVRLKGEVPAVDKPQVIQQLCTLFDLDADVLLAIYRDKADDERIAGQDVEAFMEKYIVQLEKCANGVDRL